MTPEKSRQAALMSVIVGAGAAAVTYVVARLMLQRDPLTNRALSSGRVRGEALAGGADDERALGAGADSPKADQASGADPEGE